MEITPQHEGKIGELVPLEAGRDYQAEAESQARILDVEDELHKYFLDLVTTHEKTDENKWRDIKKQWVRARNYFDGRQYGYVTNTNQWVDYPKQAGEVNYTKNVFQPHIQTALMELSRGQVELNFSYIAPDSHKGELIKRVAEARYLTHKRRLFTSAKRDQENLSLLMNGVALRYTYFDWNSTASVPEFGDREADEMTATVCAECGVPVQDAACARCGSEETATITAGVQMNAVNSYDKRPTGENNWVSVDPLGVTFYLQATEVKETPYIIWRQSILKDILQAKYKDTNITDGKSEQMMDKEGTDGATPNVQSVGLTQGDGANADFVQAWFDYEVYCHRKVKKDTKLRNGKILKAGTTLGEAFPHGLYLAVNGQTVLDVWNESKNAKWTVTPYVTRMGTMIGAGSTIALDSQDRKNDLANLHMANAFTNAFPYTFVNTNLLEAEALPNDPREVVAVSQLPDGTRGIIGSVADRMPPISLSSDAYMLEDKDDQLMQLQLGTFSGSASGMPDLAAIKNTATAYLAYRNTMVGRFAPMLAAKADRLDREQAYQFLENDQKHLAPEQWKLIAGDHGTEAVKAFMACNLRDELVIEVVGETYMPTTRQDGQAKVSAFSEFLASGVDPQSEFAAFAADKFDVPLHLISFNVVHDATLVDIDKMREVAEMITSELGDVPTIDVKADPKVLQLAQLVISEAGLEVTPSMDNHAAVIDALKDWWNTDAARSATNLLKASAILLEQMHQLAIAQDAASQMELQMIAQAPMMEQQQAEQQAAQEQEMAAQQEQAEQAQQGEILNKVVDVAQQERDRETDLEKERIKGSAQVLQSQARAA